MSIYKNSSFLIFLGCRYYSMTYLFHLRNTKPVMHMFNNKYDKKNNVHTPCFSTRDMVPISYWDPAKLPTIA